MRYIYDKMLYWYCYAMSGILLKQGEMEETLKLLKEINDGKRDKQQ